MESWGSGDEWFGQTNGPKRRPTVNDAQGVICIISTHVGTRLDYSGTITVIRHLNARFANSETGMTQLRKFEDRQWTLLLFYSLRDERTPSK